MAHRWIRGKARVAVEAKALDVPLTDQAAAQAVSYASILGEEWAVVTNARHWRLYHAFAQAPLPDKHIFSADLVGWETDAQFDSVFELQWLVSKESFEASGGPGSWLASRQLDHMLRSTLVDPSSSEVKYIRKQLDHRGVTVTAEQVAAWLKARLDAPAAQGESLSERSLDTVVLNRTSVVRGDHGGMEATAQTSGPKPKGKRSRIPGEASRWLVPAGPGDGYTSAQHLKFWLDEGFWGFWESTPGRKSVRAGDWIVFYASKLGLLMAFARVASCCRCR